MPAQIDATGLTGVMAFTSIQSDDGKFALIELVARTQTVFAVILADATVKTWLKGRDNRADAEAAFQKLRANFSIDHFGAIVP
jgi:hypothetical protein